MPPSEPGITGYVQRMGRKLLATDGPAVTPLAETQRVGSIAARVGTIYWYWERAVYRFICRHDRATMRALHMLPGLVTWALILAPFILARPAPILSVLLALAFQAYWLLRGLGMLMYGGIGWARVRAHANIDWYALYEAERKAGTPVLPWAQVRHLVIIPNYNEPIDKLRATLEGLAGQREMASRIWAVLAMEAREAGAEAKAQALQREFAGRLGGVYYTIHPDGLPGEEAVKGANETWAARWARHHLIERLGHDHRHVTITSCDADSVFHPSYFLCLTAKFATDPQRYLRIWQAPVLFHNNVWRVPSFVRFGTAMAAIVQLAGLCDPQAKSFPMSTYSASLALVDGVGYWDPDAIADDWHMFLKCFFRRWGRVAIEPIYLPVSADATLAHGFWSTAVNRYEQVKRHAWGVCDLAYAIRNYFQHAEIPARVKLPRVWALAVEHLIWSTSWPVITFGLMVPCLLNPGFAVSAQGVFLGRLYAAIGVIAGILSPALVLIDILLRPPRPARTRWWQTAWSALQWPLVPIFMFLFGTLPAIDAQTRLMLGETLAFRVTEKA
jgi:hypothetical protein